MFRRYIVSLLYGRKMNHLDLKWTTSRWFICQMNHLDLARWLIFRPPGPFTTSIKSTEVVHFGWPNEIYHLPPGFNHPYKKWPYTYSHPHKILRTPFFLVHKKNRNWQHFIWLILLPPFLSSISVNDSCYWLGPVPAPSSSTRFCAGHWFCTQF